MGKKVKYKNITIPDILYNRAEEYIYDQGFTSVSDLTKNLLRSWINQVEAAKQMDKAREPIERAFKLANEGRDKEAAEILRELE